MGINVTEEQVKDISKKSSFSEMKEKAEKEKVNPNHTVCVLTSNKKLIFRKGKSCITTELKLKQCNAKREAINKPKTTGYSLTYANNTFKYFMSFRYCW